jgi:hypothetical protein
MHLRELLRTFGWTVIDSTSRVDQALAAIKQGLAFMLIIDDDHEWPAAIKLRQVMADPIGPLVPTICFVLEAHRSDIEAVRMMGRPRLVDKPLTPSKFIPGFTDTVKTWENQPFLNLRRTGYAMMSDKSNTDIKILEKLVPMEKIGSLAAQSLALRLRATNQHKNAEQLLLQTLKSSPRDFGTMIQLADLYQNFAMPKVAQRLFTAARNAFSGTPILLPDLFQCAMALGDLQTGSDILREMQRQNLMGKLTSQFLARIHLTQGEDSEAEKVISNRITFEKIRRAWETAEALPQAS